MRLGGNLKDFLQVVDYIYRGDPHYVRPLDLDVKGRLSPKHPFFDHGQAAIFTAYRNGYCVGRITAQIDRQHLELHQDGTGFFGFFDTTDDPEVARVLLDRAARWLRARGMHRMAGPFSLSSKDEVGCLVDGFDSPPMLMMPHHRPYQGELIEGAGLSRLRTLYAWRYEVGNVKPRVQKAEAEIDALPEVTSRHVDMRNLERDVRLIVDITNDAWSEHWFFAPLTERELKQIAADMKLLVRPELTQLVFIDGEPAAVALALPNLNEATADLNGKLFPTGIAKLLYRLKVRRPETARLVFLGIRKKFRSQRKYAGLSLGLYSKLNSAGQELGIRWGELSWTDEQNGAVNAAIKMMGARIYKRLAVYDRPL